ncbi:hypothetical protein JCM10207_008197 [Rhodosporidiobolus poonsookiae]
MAATTSRQLLPTDKALAVDQLRRAELATPAPDFPLAPLLPPDAARQRALPALPLRDSSSFRPGWRVDSYVVPAAFPRMQRNGTSAPGEPSPVAHRPAQGDRIDYDELLLDVLGEQIETVNDAVLDVEREREALEKQQQLYLAVNRYVPTRRSASAGKKTAVSLVVLHGNGMHKEIMEPVLRPLLDQLEAEGDVEVEEIWALDSVNQGDSELLNADVMGKGSNWLDYARDLLNFLLVYIDSPTLSSPSSPGRPAPLLEPSAHTRAELLLNARAPQPAGTPLPSHRLFRNKRLVGIGHSFGGSILGLAATACPAVFSSVIILDPWLISKDFAGSVIDGGFFRSVALRRDSWTSREEAVKSLTSKGLFGIWDPEIVETFMRYGLRDLPDGRVALKCSARIESLLYANAYGWQGTYLFRRLKEMDGSLPIHLILPSPKASINPPHQQAGFSELAAVSIERVNKSHHLMPQCQPKRAAEVIARRIGETYGRRAEGKPRL